MKAFLLFIALCSGWSSFAQTTEKNKSQYADILVDAFLDTRHTRAEDFYGGTGRIYPIPLNPDIVLGNNKYFLSLPKGTFVTVGFTDNEIIDFPGQDDIFISEIGCSGERADVYISSDEENFVYLGEVDDCRTSSLDIGKIDFKGPVRYIKVMGKDSKGGSPGFDLVSIKGLPYSNKEVYAPIDSIVNYVDDTVASDKKFILENVLFESNSSVLLPSSFESLDELAAHLSSNEQLNIKISGHTDNVGSEEDNLKLSESRAQSVVQYLIDHGIAAERLSYEGFGETSPIKTNTTAAGRAINRRVEFEIVKH